MHDDEPDEQRRQVERQGNIMLVVTLAVGAAIAVVMVVVLALH